MKKPNLPIGVTVQLWHASEVPHHAEAEIGVAFAKMGQPVEVRIANARNQSHVMRLTMAQARELHAQLAPIAGLDPAND